MINLEPFYSMAALLPIIFLLIAIMVFGMGVAKAAPIGMLLAGIIACFIFRSSSVALTLEIGKGAWNAMTILLVIWPALFSYELICQLNGFRVICEGIQSLTQHKLIQILILGWVFPSFLQGITGFGVAVAVGAPLLVSIGVTPLYSIVIVLLGHCWGATFGTLALAWEALVAQAGMTTLQNMQAALLAAIMIWFYNFICVLLCCWMYGKHKALREALPAVALLTIIMGGGEVVFSVINPTIACFLPSAAGLLAALLLTRTNKYRRAWEIPDSKIILQTREVKENENKQMGFHQAFLPYYILIVFAVVCLLIPPVNDQLNQWKLSLSFPETKTGYGFVTAAEPCFSPIRPLTYAGTFLAASSAISFLYYRAHSFLKADALTFIWKHTAKKSFPPTIAILSLLIMSKFMSSSGMIYVLSEYAVIISGRMYLLVSPFLGMIGAFITSSNMSSNILMGSFQRTAADLLGVNPAITAALQTVGGVLGNAFAPGCVIMGITTTGFSGRDSDILRKMIPISIVCGALFGLFAFCFIE